MKTETRIKGKAIYQPAGAAEEYSKWACNLYKGCDHNCTYCYCKHGPLAHALGGPHAVLKSTLGNEQNAVRIFHKELDKYRSQIIADGGLFFSFSSDPFLPQSTDLSMSCIMFALEQGVPVYVLTKATGWVYDGCVISALYSRNALLHIGFTLTGHDELEPGAPSNKERIETIRHLSEKYGFSIFASMEPVIDFEASLSCIIDIAPFVKELRIGLLSPYSPRRYDWMQCDRFIDKVKELSLKHGLKVYWKDSVNRFFKEAMPAKMQRPTPIGSTKVHVSATSCHVEENSTFPSLPSACQSHCTEEEVFRDKVSEEVQKRLNKFTLQDNLRIVYVPLVITELAWQYAFSAIEKAANYRIPETRKLSRVVRMLHTKQRDLYRKDFQPQHIRNIEDQAKAFSESVSTLLMQLCFCASNEIYRVAQDLPYHDLRTDAFVAIVLLDWHREHNKRTDSIIIERMGTSARKYETPIHDALRDAMAAFVSPANPAFNMHIGRAMKILENKINTTDFKPFLE